MRIENTLFGLTFEGVVFESAARGITRDDPVFDAGDFLFAYVRAVPAVHARRLDLSVEKHGKGTS